MSDYYILDNKTPIKCDLLKWASWFETANRKVALTHRGAISISTMFVGLDRQWGEGPPLLFETMVFSGRYDGEMRRLYDLERSGGRPPTVMQGGIRP